MVDYVVETIFIFIDLLFPNFTPREFVLRKRVSHARCSPLGSAERAKHRTQIMFGFRERRTLDHKINPFFISFYLFVFVWPLDWRK